MNKIYKVMYSKVKQCCVVVSEIAKSHGRHTKRSVAKSSAALTAGVLIALGSFSFEGMPVVQAADGTESLRNNDFVGANDYYWYYDEKEKDKDKKWKTYQYKATDIFNNRSRHDLPNYQGGGAKLPGAITAGLYAQAGQQTVTIGDRNAGQSKGSVFIGEHSGYNNGDNAPAGMKNNYVTSVGFQSDATGWGSIAIGSNATAENSKMESQVVEEVGNANTSGTVSDDTYGIKENPTIQGASVALGYNAHSKDGNIAIGSYSDATSTDKNDSYVSVGNANLKRRITNVAEGTNASDVATVGQLMALEAKSGTYKAGFGIEITPDTTTKENTIKLSRNLGRDMDSTDKATLVADESKSALVLGGRVEEGQSKKGQIVEKPYGAFGQDSVVVGGANNIADKDGVAAVVIGGTTNTASAQYSTVAGGNNNDAFGNESSVFGGFDNDAFGAHATLSGGSMNRAYGAAASVFGGGVNSALGDSSVAVGGLQSTVNGTFAVGIAGGSTNADYALAAGNGANVIVENGTAIGYQATTDEAGTIAFGHDAGDAYYSSTTWPQKATKQNGKYYDANNKEISKAKYDALKNSDGTWNDYSKTPTVVEKTYDKAAYNRLVKVADGKDDHDVVVMEQLTKATNDLTKDLSVNAGWGINIADEKDPKTGEVTKKNVISLNRNLGTNNGNTEANYNGKVYNGKVSFETKGKNSLILGGEASTTFDTNVTAGTDGDYSVLVGGYNNSIKSAGKRAVVAAGSYNKASGENSAVIGGSYNQASGDSSVVIGGGAFSDDQGNQASGQFSTIIGGDGNKAKGINDVVSGGYKNESSGASSFIGGGQFNEALGFATAILGGVYNMGVDATTVVGGQLNLALAYGAFAAGGNANQVAGLFSAAIGGEKQKVIGNYSTAIGGASTGIGAEHATAIGSHAVVTSKNGLALGYKATADKEGTISFGHDKGDVSGYESKIEYGPYGYYSGEVKSYLVPPASGEDARSVVYTPTYYESAEYNRLVKVDDGKDAHDAVVMEQLKPYTKSDASNIGSNLKTYTVGDNGETITEAKATPEQQKTNKDDWGKALGAGTFTTGTDTTPTNASASDQLVTGKTLYNYDKPTGTLNYVSANSTTGQNLTALDTQVKANADTLNDPTHNIKYYSVNSNAPLFGQDSISNAGNDGTTKGKASIAAGFVTHADGHASTVVGSYSGVFNEGTAIGPLNMDWRGATALSYGAVNINRNTDATKLYSGVANSLIGQANVTTNSNAAIILGAGNTVKNSYRDVDTKTLFGSGTIDGQMRAAVPQSGGQVMVMGGGNNVDKAYMTQVTGVGNTVKGDQVKNDKGEWVTSNTDYNSDTSSQLNYVEGFYTTLTNGKNDYIIGAHNTVTGDSTATNQSNIVFGDNHTMNNQSNNVIIGSADAEDTTAASNVVSIGHNAKVSAEGGVAIGSGSEATTEAGVAGYDPTGATADTTAAWTSKKAAVSVGTADETRQITGVAAGKEETDAVNVAQLKKLNGMKANVDATNIGKNLKGADGNTASAEDITANEKAWGAALGTGDIATPKDMLVTDKAIHDELRPTTDGTYVKGSQTTADNLLKLDAQVKTNADGISTNTTNITKNAGDITNLKNLSNITNEGEKVIKKLSKDAVKVEAGDRVTVTSTDNKETGTITYKVSANNNGTVTAGDQNLVSGDTVNTAINNAINNAGTTTDTKLAGKANVNADNIGKNLNHKADGTAVTDEDKTANENDWGAAIGTGSIAADNGQLVTGKTVYAYNKPVAAEGKTLNYVSDTKTTGQNLGSLDAQVGTNTGDISNLKNLSNISSAGETVIKNLAKGSIGMEDGSHTTASHRDVNGVDTYKVDVTVDGQVTENNKGIVDGGTVYNAIQDVKTKTSADLANKANVDASNLSDENVKSWWEKLGNGEVVSGNKGLVTGDTVFKAVDTKANRDGSNLTDKEADSFSEKIAKGEVKPGENRAVSGDAVSQAISKVTGDMNTKLDGKANTSLDNITKDGQTVIKKLSQDAVQVKGGTAITVDDNVDDKGNKTYMISANNNGKVEKDDGNLISGDTLYKEVHVDKDGTYIKSKDSATGKDMTVAQNLSALDTGLKTTSDLIHMNDKGDIQIGGSSKATKIDVSGKDSYGKTTGRVITGVVTDAQDASSAANVGYVNGVTAANTQQIYRDMNSAYGRLNNNINKAAAGSNALAALHPLDYDPDDKADFAVGYGHYRNANAAAVGAFYHPNENTMVNVGVSLGNGDPGFNAGVSFKVGRGGAGREAMSKTEMAKVINSQSKEIDALKKDNADKDKRIDALEQKMAEILAKLDKNGK